MDSKRDTRRRVDGTREWSILELARLVGVTRRTLRHYAEIGLLTPIRVSKELASRHVAWLRSIPGTPAHAAPTADAVLRRYVEGLAHMYVDDPRFGRSYDRHPPGTAEFVRDALLSWCESAASASGESAPPAG